MITCVAPVTSDDDAEKVKQVEQGAFQTQINISV
jgi:hypothetical protein